MDGRPMPKPIGLCEHTPVGCGSIYIAFCAEKRVNLARPNVNVRRNQG